jgi:sec-independent protein translocase protein TatA
MGLENPLHIAFILIIALLVFGAKRLPEMGRSLGSGMRGFRDALTGERADATPALNPPNVTPAQAAQPQPQPHSQQQPEQRQDAERAAA